jgi:hypothetical protein
MPIVILRWWQEPTEHLPTHQWGTPPLAPRACKTTIAILTLTRAWQLGKIRRTRLVQAILGVYKSGQEHQECDENRQIIVHALELRANVDRHRD